MPEVVVYQSNLAQWIKGGDGWEVGPGSVGTTGGNDYAFVLIYDDLAIPAGSKIVSAVAQFKAVVMGPGVHENLYFNNVDDATFPGDAAAAESLDLSTEVAWEPSGRGYINSPDLAAILQSIIDLPGWVSGNQVQLVARDNSSTGYGYVYKSGWSDHSLTVNYTDGAVISEPPAAELTLTPHAPTVSFIGTAFPPVAALIATAYDPKSIIAGAMVPAVSLTISAPQNAEEPGTVISLLNFNDTPGTETITDETGRAWTVPHPVIPTETLYANNAEVSAEGPLDGMGSLSLPSSVSYIKTPYTADLDVGARDFTFECWHKCDEIEDSLAAFLANDNGTPYPIASGLQIGAAHLGLGSVGVYLGCTDGTYVNLSEIQILRATWKHFALVRKGRTVYGFDHGVLTKTATFDEESNGVLNPPLNGYTIGASLGYSDGLIHGSSFWGNISGVKLTVGNGKWTSEFTPPAEPSTYEGLTFRSYGRLVMPALALELIGYGPQNFVRRTDRPPVVTLELTANNPSAVWTLNAAMRPASQVIYLCTLTGAPDGEDDVLIPISSFQSDVRDGDPSYLSCVVPNSPDWEVAISARPNGEIVIQKGYRLIDGTVILEEVIRVDFETLRIDRGARNDSATIVGHKTTTATAPKTWAVQGVSFYGLQASGKRRIRAEIDLFLRAGDTVIYGPEEGDSFLVSCIMYSVSVDQAIMEVSEGSPSWMPNPSEEA